MKIESDQLLWFPVNVITHNYILVYEGTMKIWTAETFDNTSNNQPETFVTALLPSSKRADLSRAPSKILHRWNGLCTGISAPAQHRLQVRLRFIDSKLWNVALQWVFEITVSKSASTLCRLLKLKFVCVSFRDLKPENILLDQEVSIPVFIQSLWQLLQ